MNMNLEEKLKELTKGLGLGNTKEAEEAQKLWAHLDKLAKDDPKGYQNYIQQQRMEHKKDQMEADARRKAKLKRLPEPVFVVQTKRMDIDFSPMIYLNICKHVECPPPQLANGQTASMTEKAGNVVIPLSVGPLWDWKDSTEKQKDCHVVDIIFHPDTLTRCQRDMEFKLFTIELGLQNVEEDHTFRLNRSYKTMDEHKYLGPEKSPAARWLQAWTEEEERKIREKEILKMRQEKKDILSGKKNPMKAKEPELKLRPESSTKKKTKKSQSKAKAPEIVLPFDVPAPAAEQDNDSMFDLVLPGNQAEKPPEGKSLIEVVSEPVAPTSVVQQPVTPTYTVTVMEAALVEEPDMMKIIIPLPLDVQMQDIEVDISVNSVRLCGKCEVTVELPRSVKSHQAAAKLLKKKHALKITAPCE